MRTGSEMVVSCSVETFDAICFKTSQTTPRWPASSSAVSVSFMPPAGSASGTRSNVLWNAGIRYQR